MRRFIALVIVCLLLLPLCASAQSLGKGSQRVFDQAHLMVQSEIDSLESQIAAMRKKYDMDFVILTSQDAKSGRSQAYADDFYDRNGFGTGIESNGFLFFIDMNNRVATVSTTGIAIRYLTDTRLQALLDASYPYLSSGEYAKAAAEALKQMGGYINNGIPQNQFNQDEEGTIDRYQVPKAVTMGEAGIALLCGFAAALILVIWVRRSYAMKGSAYAYDLNKNAQVKITGATDVFLRTQVTRVPRASANGGGAGGGRSSTHRSSSGRIHGGGSGRKF